MRLRGERLIWAWKNNRPFSSSIHSSHSQQIGRFNHLGFDLPDVWPSTSETCSQLSSIPQSINGPTAEIIDGKSIATMIKAQVAGEILRMKDTIGKRPSLAVVLIGQRKDSHSFVRTKMKACDKVGIVSSVVELHADCTEDETLHVISNLNKDPSVHGILVQLPLPDHLNEEKVLNVVNPEKDVDGFHPVNMGCLAMKGREPFFIPCAAKSCIDILLRSGIEISGKNAVVIGRSKISGLPVSLLLQDPNKKHGFQLTGDVCFEEAVRVASAITPVPGGLGPVTISMLLSNTLDSAKLAFGFI